MSSYEGYVDAATRNALEKMDSENGDLSVCGRIAPLLIQSDSKDAFMSNVDEFTTITHNSSLAKTAAAFFAELLWDSTQNQDVAKNLQTLKGKYPDLRNWIDQGVASAEDDAFDAIREFGPACGVDGGFAGVVHLLSRKEDFTSVMQKNAKAGGDSAARGMVVAMILGAQDDCVVNEKWTNQINKIEKIRSYL